MEENQPLTDQNGPLWSLLTGLRVSGWLQAAFQGLKAHWTANFSGYQKVILTELETQERKFVADSQLKKTVRSNLL